MVTSESVPFSKSGGLADVVGALSQSIAELGNNVKVFMPMYSFIEKKGFKKSTEFEIPMLGSKEKADTLEKKVGRVTYVALEHPWFTERSGIYGDSSFAPYADNCPRFLLFAKAVAKYIKATDEKFDVVHCHDWTAGLVPYFLSKENIKSKTVFTIHNLAYQGDFSAFDALLSSDVFPKEALLGIGDEKRINMLRCGIALSDIITTVSPTYAKEIQTKEFGCNLDSILRERNNNLEGIINGIDYSEWNSSNDKFFNEHFSSSSLSGKERLKRRVLEENGLIVDSDIPLFTMISRLAEQKGFTELLLEGKKCVLERILEKNNCQFIIIGTGDGRYESKLKELESRFSNLVVHIMFSNKSAHNLEGAADFFLMPSRYEPCGLNQLYSLHYGTLVVAHRTGGLADTIQDLDENPDDGDGFLFSALDSNGIIGSVDKAIELFYDKKKLNKARKNAMKKDFTWTRSAKEYVTIYDKIARKNNTGGKKK